MLAFFDGLLKVVHVLACLILIFVVLLQQGKGGGMGAAFGGGQAAQVFGGSGAGNILTRATAVCATIFMLTSVGLAYMSSSGDRALKAKVAAESGKKKDRGTPREKESGSAAPPPAPSGSSPAPTTPGSPGQNP